jgi:hypothetical protein
MITANDLIIIRNFSKISDQLYFTTDGILRAKYETSVYAIAKLETVFVRPFGIYSVQTLLSLLSTYKDYSIEYKPDCLEVLSDKSRLKYKYSQLVQEVPLVKLPDGDYKFNLTSENIKQLQRHSSILKTPLLRIYRDKNSSELVLQLTNSEQSSSHTFEINCGKCSIDIDDILDFRLVNLLECDYEVSIKPNAFINFKCISEIVDIVYYYTFKQPNSSGSSY